MSTTRGRRSLRQQEQQQEDKEEEEDQEEESERRETSEEDEDEQQDQDGAVKKTPVKEQRRKRRKGSDEESDASDGKTVKKQKKETEEDTQTNKAKQASNEFFSAFFQDDAPRKKQLRQEDLETEVEDLPSSFIKDTSNFLEELDDGKEESGTDEERKEIRRKLLSILFRIVRSKETKSSLLLLKKLLPFIETAAIINATMQSFSSSPEIIEEDSLTALHHAAAKANHRFCSYLLQCGADPTLTDSNGRVALSDFEMTQVQKHRTDAVEDDDDEEQEDDDEDFQDDEQSSNKSDRDEEDEEQEASASTEDEDFRDLRMNNSREQSSKKAKDHNDNVNTQPHNPKDRHPDQNNFPENEGRLHSNNINTQPNNHNTPERPNSPVNSSSDLYEECLVENTPHKPVNSNTENNTTEPPLYNQATPPPICTAAYMKALRQDIDGFIHFLTQVCEAQLGAFSVDDVDRLAALAVDADAEILSIYKKFSSTPHTFIRQIMKLLHK